jgi:DNA-binding CsgD family transcriptional regulator
MVASIAVAVDPIGPADRIEVFSRSHGLTPRETESLHKLASGASTRIAARQLGLSEYTLQDHLKAMFAKTSTGSRAELIAMATGAGPV